jgi:hypothetical protein
VVVGKLSIEPRADFNASCNYDELLKGRKTDGKNQNSKNL